MIDKIIAAVLEHFGFTEEHAQKIQKIVDMIKWEEIDDKKMVVISPGSGIEIRITQPDTPDEEEDDSGVTPQVA